MTFPPRRLFPPRPTARERRFLAEVFRRETVGGALAIGAAIIALVWANLGGSYNEVRHFQVGPFDVEHWASGGALTIFFFLAGLEVKRELLVGSLRRPADAAVPIVAACCGVIGPALVFLALNAGTDNLRGWAIPAATDIAFALAVLAVVGSALPPSLRAFLLTLAVVDDLIVIAIIATFYTSTLEWWPLLGAGVCFLGYALGRRRVPPWLLVVVAVGAWWFTSQSGVHATVAGVILGLLTPVEQAETIEHRLVPWSSGLAVPFFALMSAGVAVNVDADLLTDPVVLGVGLGLVVGKPVGILLGTWAVTSFTRARMDSSLSWSDLAGLALLGGVGFTVSLLVSDLSWPDIRADEAKAAVLAGSLVTALLGGLLLARRNRRMSRHM